MSAEPGLTGEQMAFARETLSLGKQLADVTLEARNLRADNADLRSKITWRDERISEYLARIAELENALASVPLIAEEIRVKWDEGMRAGKLLVALIDPSLRYRPDTDAIHQALAGALLCDPRPSFDGPIVGVRTPSFDEVSSLARELNGGEL